jgi:hypothetical protein
MMRLQVKRNELPTDLTNKIDAAKRKLPEMRIEETDLGDALNFKNSVQLWQAIMAGGNFVKLVGAFFELLFIRVISVFSWAQPLIKVKTVDIVDQDGHVISISGFVINVINTDDSLQIMRMANEPGASAEFIDGKEIHPKLQPTAQASATKLAAVQAGEVEKDKGLAALLEFFKRKGIVFEDLVWQITDCCHDTNHFHGLVAYTTVNVDIDELEEIASEIGGIILGWEEYDEIFYNQPELLNSHSLFPILVEEDI